MSSFCREEAGLALLALPAILSQLACYLPLLDRCLALLQLPTTGLQLWVSPAGARAAETAATGLALPIILLAILPAYRRSVQPCCCNITKLAGSLTSQTRQTGGPSWARERRERATTCSRSRRKAGPARRASTWRWSSETVTCTTNTTNDTDWGHHLISTQNYCKLVANIQYNMEWKLVNIKHLDEKEEK